MTDDPLFETSDGNTPIQEDEAQGLRPSWVRTRGDLNDAEAANILKGRRAIRSPTLAELTDTADRDHLWVRVRFMLVIAVPVGGRHFWTTTGATGIPVLGDTFWLTGFASGHHSQIPRPSETPPVRHGVGN